MNKEQAKAVQTEALDALKLIYARHGLTLTRTSASFDESSFNLTVKATSQSADDQSATWARYAPSYGLPLDGLGAKITLNRKVVRITGLDLNRRSFPVRVEDVMTGKVSLFRADAVRRALASRISVEA